jgi:hypothetical protein
MEASFLTAEEIDLSQDLNDGITNFLMKSVIL